MIACVNFRTNEVTRLKEKESNATTMDYDRLLSSKESPRNSTFDIASYFSGADQKPGKGHKQSNTTSLDNRIAFPELSNT